MEAERAEHIVEDHCFAVRVNCRYVVQRSREGDDSLVVIALHGYGMDAETMLRLTATWFPEKTIVSIQAPHPFYRDVRTRAVGYSWATHTQSEESVRVHHEMLLHVLGATEASPERRLLIGFSQPVGLNYRFAATHPEAVAGVIGVCGGMPGNWNSGNYREVRAKLLHIARTEDDVYPSEVTRHYAERLKTRAKDVEVLELAGGHRFPSLAQPVVRDWVRRKFRSSITHT